MDYLVLAKAGLGRKLSEELSQVAAWAPSLWGVTKKGNLRFFDHLPTKECKIAFHRGFIESINTADTETINASGFDLIPLQTLRTGSNLIEKFKGFTKLKRLEYHGQDASPARLPEYWRISLPGFVSLRFGMSQALSQHSGNGVFGG